MRRIRIKLNRIASLPERKRVGRKIMADIGIKLQMGWNPFTERIAPKAYALMFETLDKFLVVKTKDNRPDTVRGYTSYVKIFKKWLLEHGFDESSYVCSFTESDASTLWMTEIWPYPPEPSTTASSFSASSSIG